MFFVQLQCLAHVEAFIDFSEGELIEDGVLNQGASPNLEKTQNKTLKAHFPSTEWRNFLFAPGSLLHIHCMEIVLESKC